MRKLVLAVVVATLGACSGFSGRQVHLQDGPPRGHFNAHAIADAVPRVEPLAATGNPESYVVYGQRYYPLKSSKGFVETGIASWYGTKFHGRKTSSGEPYDLYKMTAAHKTLPLPTYVEVTNLENGRKVVVKVNDRGPFHDDRIIDLSYAAAVKLGFEDKGTARVEIRAIDPRAPKTHLARSQPASVPEAVQKPLYLQVGSFSSRPNAESLRQLIVSMSEEVPVEIAQASGADATVFRVRVGPLNSASEAERYSALLAMIGITEPSRVWE